MDRSGWSREVEGTCVLIAQGGAPWWQPLVVHSAFFFGVSISFLVLVPFLTLILLDLWLSATLSAHLESPCGDEESLI